MSEFLRLYPGTSPDQFLTMPAMRMFALMTSGRKLRSRDRNAFYYELCSIAMLPSQNKKYFNGIQGYYRKLVGALPTRDNKAFDLADPNLNRALTQAFNKGMGR